MQIKAIMTRTEDMGSSLCAADKQPAHGQGRKLNTPGDEEVSAQVYVC